MSFLYVDVMRVVFPGKVLNGDFCDFYLFGGFDAIHIDTNVGTISDLTNCNKKRHKTVPVYYDRQPLYIYSPKAIIPDLLSRKDENGDRPLVFSLFQLDDIFLKKKTPEELIDIFDELVRKQLVDKQIGEEIIYQVFWNLGESDCVVIFRGNKLEDIGKTLFRLRTINENGIRVLATSSHCAFPLPEESTATGKSIRELLEIQLEKWLKRDNGLNLFTLMNTSYGLQNIKKIKGLETFLFGEWDYYKQWGESEYKSYAKDVICGFDNTELNIPGVFRTAYTVLAMKLGKDIIHSNKNKKRTLSGITHISNDHDWIDKVELPEENNCDSDNAFVKLIREVKELENIYGNGVKKLANDIKSLGYTLTGLSKHLYRLLAGRFEQDLYAFVKPIFIYVLRITLDHSKILSRMRQEYISANNEGDRGRAKAEGLRGQISLILDDYVQGLSEILSQLQHLFSILSVSPHTFLETYGSNMRSLAAACKLLIAYQGVTYCLNKDYNDKLLDENGVVRKTNHITIVLPYRNVHTNNIILFPLSDPKYRIAYIQIDFTEMFNVRNSIFLILHESAHHLVGIKLRKKRARCYTRAVMKELIGESFGIYFMNGMSAPEWLKDASLDEREINLEAQIDKDIREACVTEITLAQKEIAQAMADSALNAYSDYIEHKKSMVNLSLLKNKMANYVTFALKDWIQENCTPEYFDQPEEWSDGLVRYTAHVIFYCHWRMIRSAIENMEDDDSRMRLALWKERFYYVPEPNFDEHKVPTPDKIIQERIFTCLRAAFMVLIRRSDEVCDDMNLVFSDVFSDIFAILMLKDIENTSASKKRQLALEYLRRINDMSGSNRDIFMLSAKTLCRVWVILKTFYDISEVNQMLELLIEIRSVNDHDKKFFKENPEKFMSENNFYGEINRKIEEINNSLYFEEISKYVEYCIEEIENRVKKSRRLQELQNYLADMCSDNVSKVIESIYYFWQSSTQRRKESLKGL